VSSVGALQLSDIRDLLAQLVAIDSVNPTLVPSGAGEAEIGRFVGGWLERNGVSAEYHDLGDTRANVIARVPGKGHGRSLLLNAHLDTVGVGGDDAGLSPRVEGNRLYGRGSVDMKGSLSVLMLVAAAAARRPLAGDLILTAVADEEAYSIGTEAVAKTMKADAAVVAEPTEMQVVVAHKGFVWLEVSTDGVAAHGSRYDLGVDAIARMGPVLAGLARLDESLRAEREPHPLLGGASVHASLIEGGKELSTYPDRCVVKIERRTLPGETVRDVEEEVRGLAGDDATVKTLFVREPLSTEPDEPIVAALIEHATAVLGRRPDLVGVPFWTDAALLSAAGIPTVVFGPRGAGAHADVEWVDLDDLLRLAQILLATASAFCS
jgi:acetylornithine deacetylase